MKNRLFLIYMIFLLCGFLDIRAEEDLLSPPVIQVTKQESTNRSNKPSQKRAPESARNQSRPRVTYGDEGKSVDQDQSESMLSDPDQQTKSVAESVSSDDGPSSEPVKTQNLQQRRSQQMRENRAQVPSAKKG